MKINEIKINGVPDPIGFDLSDLTVSYKVTDALESGSSKSFIRIYQDEALTRLIKTVDENVSSIATSISLPLQPRTRYWFTIEVWAGLEKVISEPHYFETGKMDEPWEAKVIGTKEETDSRHPVFFRSFKADKKVASARLYVTGLGLYEASLNGEKVGCDYLTPHCTDYSSRIQYDTYDVTGMLQNDNLLEIAVGNGWYKGRIGYEGAVSYYGDRFSCLCELRICYEDGTQTSVFSDESWSYRFSHVLESDIYDGELIDDTVDVSDVFSVRVLPFDYALIKERQSLPVRVKMTIPVKEVIHNDLGETILDFGQNFAGFVSFRNRLKKGERITLEHGEILQQGHFYNANLRTAKAVFSYISDGEDKVIRPHFTFFGFRYVRVTGRTDVDPEDFTGNVLYSDLDSTLSFSSSSEKLNRLQLNTLFGQRSNFIDIPTDCPQRDERLGWTGDANVFSPTACYQMDTRAFYHKFLTDLRDDQVKHGGAVANYVPNITGAGGSSVWGDAAIAIPMNVYHAYGDVEALRSHYPLMRDWMEYIIRIDRENGDPHLWNSGFHFGDWLALDGITEQSFKGGTDDYYVASMCYYQDLRKMMEAAKILNFSEDHDRYAKLSELVKEAILNEYFTPSGRLAMDTQTGYLLALSTGVYHSKEKVIEGLLSRFTKDAYRIRAGFVGATIMLQTLAENGLSDLAAYFLFQEGYPGWMHCIDLGATTVWERWNTVLDDGTINPAGMNSLNHYAYGSVMEYVYKYLAGIRPMEPGCRKVRIAPMPTWRLKDLSVAYDSAAGVYASHVHLEQDGSLTFSFSVPFDGQALVFFPGTDKEEVFGKGDYSFHYQPNVNFLQKYNENSILAEMIGDEEAIRIFRKYVPMLDPCDTDSRSLRLKDLKAMFYLGITPETAESCIQELARLQG